MATLRHSPLRWGHLPVSMLPLRWAAGCWSPDMALAARLRAGHAVLGAPPCIEDHACAGQPNGLVQQQGQHGCMLADLKRG